MVQSSNPISTVTSIPLIKTTNSKPNWTRLHITKQINVLWIWLFGLFDIFRGPRVFSGFLFIKNKIRFGAVCLISVQRSTWKEIMLHDKNGITNTKKEWPTKLDFYVLRSTYQIWAKMVFLKWIHKKKKFKKKMQPSSIPH